MLDPTPAVTAALLRSARSEARSQRLGSRAVRREPRLWWDGLIEIYGDETVLAERVAQLRAAKLPDPNGVVDLAERYLDGWRPKDF